MTSPPHLLQRLLLEKCIVAQTIDLPAIKIKGTYVSRLMGLGK